MALIGRRSKRYEFMDSLGLVCSQCGSAEVSCTNTRSRQWRDLGVVKRTRVCLSCNGHWHTIELSLDDYDAVLEEERRKVVARFLQKMGEDL